MPTRNHDDVELAAAVDVELLDHRSVAAAFFFFVICDGAVDTVFVFVVGRGLAELSALGRVVLRLVCDAAFAATERRPEKRRT